MQLAVKKGHQPWYPLSRIKAFSPIIFTSQYERNEPIFEIVWYQALHDVKIYEPKLLLGLCAEPITAKALTQGSFRVVPPKVQISNLLSQQLERCKSTHGSCSPENQNGSTPIGTRVIDCRSRRVISAPEGCQYLALSYVWGNEKCAEHLEKTNLSSLYHRQSKMS